jgi:hypothetical protein
LSLTNRQFRVLSARPAEQESGAAVPPSGREFHPLKSSAFSRRTFAPTKPSDCERVKSNRQMKPLWCWRWKAEVPMLDDDEYRRVVSLRPAATGNPQTRFKSMLAEYERITGFRATNPNAVSTIVFQTMGLRVATVASHCEHRRPNCAVLA